MSPRCAVALLPALLVLVTGCASGPREPVALGGAAASAGGRVLPSARPELPRGTSGTQDPVVAVAGERSILASELGAWMLQHRRREALAGLTRMVAMSFVREEAQAMGLRFPAELAQKLRRERQQDLEREAVTAYGLGTSPERYLELTEKTDLSAHLSGAQEAAEERWLASRVVRYHGLTTEEVQLRLAALPKREVAEDLARRLEAGADFSALATRFSVHESRARGGLLEPTPVNSLDPQLARRVAGLQEGQRTGVLEMPARGAARWWILELVSRRGGRSGDWPTLAPEVERSLKAGPVGPEEWAAWCLGQERERGVRIAGTP